MRASRILVVDDNPSIVDILASSLGFLGYDIRTANLGQAALAAARQW